MIFWNIFSTVFLEGQSGVYGIVTLLIMWAGAWRLLEKSGIPGWWAIVPCARGLMLGRCAGRESEGRAAWGISLVGLVLDLIMLWFKNETLYLFLEVMSVAASIVYMVFILRIYSGLTEVYGARRAWMILWVLADWLVAAVWGFLPKYKPEWRVEDFRRATLSAVSGTYVEGMKDGLTVNLQERSVTEFFQKKCLLRDIHLYVQPGHMVLLLGGSGAGKTTFLNAVNGYEKARAEVTLNGGNMYTDYKKMLYEVGFVPQQELMRGKDTVYRTLLDAALLRLPASLTAADRKQRVEEVMAVFGLTPVKHNLVEKLSGGQKKRLSIAMEFVSNPSLFILDEPDSGLDGVMARELMTQLRQIADQGKIVIVITHTPDRVIDLFDDVIVLAKDADRTGRLAFYGPVSQAREFFGKERMEEIVLSINRREEGGEGRADEFIGRFAEVQHG